MCTGVCLYQYFRGTLFDDDLVHYHYNVYIYFTDMIGGLRLKLG